MPWTDAARREHARRTPCHASDLKDEEWALIAPFMLPPRKVGRPRKVDLREVVNAFLYVASTGCQWRLGPKDVAPVSTFQRYFYDWRDAGLWREISTLLVVRARELAGRAASPTAGILLLYGHNGSDLRQQLVLPDDDPRVEGQDQVGIERGNLLEVQTTFDQRKRGVAQLSGASP